MRLIADQREGKVAPRLNELEIMASKLNLPEDIKARAAMIYVNAYKEHPVYGRPLTSFLAASIYVACKERKLPLTLDKIVFITTQRYSTTRAEVRRAYWKINTILKLRIAHLKAEDYINTFCTTLKLSDKVREAARAIVEDIEKEGLTNGKKPTVVAATAIYIAAISEDERRTQRTIASIANVSEIAMRYLLKKIFEYPKYKVKGVE